MFRNVASAAPFAAFFLGAFALSCRPAVDPPAPGPPVRLILRTPPSDVHVGAHLATPPVLDVIDADDAPIVRSGLTVRAAIETGTAQITAGAETPVTNGVATFSNLTLSGSAGALVKLRFTLFDEGVANVQVAVSADTLRLIAGPPTAVRASSVAAITGTPDALATPAPAVLVTDAGQNVLPGIPVTFAVTAGEGRLSGSASSTTDANGVATVPGWVLGLPGSNQLVATVSPTLQVTFTAAVTTTSGIVRVRLTGNPAGVAAKIRVLKTNAGGGAYDVIHNVVDSLTVLGLPFGTYQLSGDSVNVGARIWQADAALTGLNVGASTAPNVGLTYREYGRLEVTTRGLPQPSLPATIDFAPTSGLFALPFAFPVVNDAVTRGLGAIGTYDAAPRVVTVAGQLYTATPAHQTVVLNGGAAPAQATVTYAVTTGTLTVVLAGTLPPNSTPLIDVTGPGGFHETVFTTGRSWTGLVPGTYTVVASPITVSAVTYTPSPVSSPAVIAAGGTTTITITYAQ